MTHRVLIVDDESYIQEGLFDFFADETDFEVRVSDSAEKGLNILKDFHPTVCVVDIRLPGMNGNEFIRKASEVLDGCVYIIHTGSIEYELPEDFEALGITMDNVLGKPVADMALFLTYIDRLCKRPRPGNK